MSEINAFVERGKIGSALKIVPGVSGSDAEDCAS